MKLVAVSIVKNEADVVEAFIRHTRTWVDQHLVFDHDSTDGTREILGELAREGLPLAVFTDQTLGNLQQMRSNHLTRLAVTEFGADWVLPLDADEFLVAPGRAVLEDVLGPGTAGEPVSLPLANYYPTEADDPEVANPVSRISHRASLANASRKLIIPSRLATEPAVVAGKGSHELHRDGARIADRPAPPGFHLAHFALRSVAQQMLRVVTAELQKLSRGRAHDGLDVHYRLGFQLLAEDPDLFRQTIYSPAKSMVFEPAPYLGGDLRHTSGGGGWQRATRALLPFLEKLARSHGELLDRCGGAAQFESGSVDIQPLTDLTLAPPFLAPAGAARPSFDGYEVVEGLSPFEGPFPGAFLPPFRWGTAPQTVLRVTSERVRSARLEIDALTYWENQSVTVELNGAAVRRFDFPRVNQRERTAVVLELTAGDNLVALRYAQHHASAADPRKLAVIFLALRITDE